MEECINFYSEGLRLEGVLNYQTDESDETVVDDAKSSITNNQSSIVNRQSVLLCSPHPNLGGDMDNNVILALAETLTRKGFITLRFNYRGVGESESRFSDLAQKIEYWENSMGTDDYRDFITDTRSAFDFLKNETEVTENQFYYIAGYSFGSILAMRVGLADKDVRGIVCISTPFGKYDLKFAEKSNKPKYFISSDNDFAASKDDVEQEFKTFCKPKTVEMITDCDHFYRGKEGLIAEKTAYYLTNFSNSSTKK